MNPSANLRDPKPIIELQSVEKTFDRIRAIAPLNLKIDAGSFVSLLGPSGCGKSTLLRMIAGLEQPSAGAVRVLAQASKGEVAYVFQDAHLLPWRTVLRNTALPLELQGASAEKQKKQALEALSKLGLRDAADLYPNQLSGGMKMRVSLARALTTEPKLLLLDEPFAALDEITRHQLAESLRTLWMDRGMTIVFVTHSLSESAYLAERTIVLTRKPARIALDHSTALPRERPARIRTEVSFAREVQTLYEVFERERMTA